MSSIFIASVHEDYLPFIAHATDSELAQFIRAQITVSRGEEPPVLEGMAKALFDSHNALLERLAETKRKKSEAGRKGGNPLLNQCLTNDKPPKKQTKAQLKPNTITITNTITDNNTPPTPPTGGTPKKTQTDLKPIWEKFTFTPGIRDIMRQWIDYKTERNQRYKPTGFNNLLVQLEKAIGEYGEQSVIDIIRESMANNWQGITWDKLSKRSNGGNNGRNQEDNRGSDREGEKYGMRF
jgi:hypothetical protein